MSGRRSNSLGRPAPGWLLAPLVGATLLGSCMTGPSGRSVRYSCEGRQVTVVFGGNVARVFDGPGSPFILDRRRVRNGFWYETATRSIRGSGRTMTYTIGRMAPLQCRKIGSGRW